MSNERRTKALRELQKRGWRTDDWKIGLLSIISQYRWVVEAPDINDELQYARQPLLWTTVVEDEHTDGKDWNYPVLVIKAVYDLPDTLMLFSACDNSSRFYFEGFAFDQQGMLVRWTPKEFGTPPPLPPDLFSQD